MQQKKSKVVKEIKDYIKLLPIALILLIVPVIVYMKEVKLDDVVATYWKGYTKDVDFFAYNKMAWFIALTSIAVIFFLFYIITKKIKFTFPKIFFPLAIYLVLVFLSSSFSKYHNQAFFGFPERFEGFFTIMCYVLVCFLCSVLINSKFDIKYLFPFLVLSILIVSVIGVTQFFGFDLFQSSFGKSIILPKANQNLAESLIFKFPDNYIYSTLYNPNYVGGLFAIILPISLILFISTRNIYHKLLLGLFSILSYITLLGSLSDTGCISAAVAGIVMLAYLRKDLKRNVLPLIAIVICFCVSTTIMNYTSGGIIFKELGISELITQDTVKSESSVPINVTLDTDTSNPEILTLQNVSIDSNKTMSGTFKTLALQNTSNTKEVLNDAEIETPTPVNLASATNTPSEITDISIDKNNLYLYVSNGDALVIKYDSASTQLLFTDNKDKSVDLTSNTEADKNVIIFNDSRFQNIKLSIKNTLVAVEAPNTVFNLVITKDGFKFVTPSGQMTDIVKAESFGFKGHEQWGSNRGYIWSRSIPMLKDTILLGHGPDTFAIYFPQNDYVAKMNYMKGIYTIVDKPHNLYLQMALNSGVLSLIAFLVFAGWYCIASLKLYFKGLNNEYFTPGIACLIGVISYLVSSIANDSTISVSPVFWIILGVGIACNRLYSNKLLSAK